MGRPFYSSLARRLGSALDDGRGGALLLFLREDFLVDLLWVGHLRSRTSSCEFEAGQI